MTVVVIAAFAAREPTAVIRASWLSLPNSKAMAKIANAAFCIIEKECGVALIGPRKNVVKMTLEMALMWALRSGTGPDDFLRELRAMVHARING